MTIRNRCPEPQVLQAFVEGRLPAAERREVLAHLDECDACMSAIDLANEFHHEQPAVNVIRPSRFRWIAAAAVLALIATALVWRVVQPRFSGPSIAQLVDEVPASARTVEPRLSGGFAWAAYVGPLRAGARLDEAQMKLAGLTAKALERARNENSAETQHTAGVALLLIGESESATGMIERAARDANDANAWNDLAAAHYTGAVQTGQASRYTEALAAADHALRIAPRHAEALFNRALVLEQLRLTNEARAAWTQYLAVDATSPWAKEARERLSKLPATSGTLLFDREQSRLERAAVEGDSAAVQRIVGRLPERSRAFGEAEYLGRWAEAFARGDRATASRNLTIARAIGDALASTTGESLLRDGVKSIETGDAARLASAHAAYRRGRMAYARQQPAAAEPQLRAAAVEFGASPMSLVARYYSANTSFDQGNVAQARSELETLLRELVTRPTYFALGAQVRWELALCHTAIDDWSGALPLFTESAELFRRLGERSNLGFVETLLADTFTAAGRPDEAAAARIRSFALTSGEQRGDLLAQILSTAATAELRSGRRDPARSLLALAQSAARAANNTSVLVDVLMQAALLEAEDGDHKTALDIASAAEAATKGIGDAPLRARATAHVQLAAAAANLPSDPARARLLAKEAIDFFRAKGFAVQLPLAYLMHARATARTGGDATPALEDGIASLERHRIQLAGIIDSSGVLDAANGLFDDAIGLAVDRGDVAGAFAYAERRQEHRAHRRDATVAVTIAQLQQRLSGSSTAVLTLVALPQRVVGIAITADGVAMSRHPIERDTLRALVARALDRNDDAALRELYDVLIRPSANAIRNAQRLIVIGDELVDAVPFAALVDESKKPLVARLSTAKAISATSLTKAEAAEPRTLLAIALPSGDATRTAALPEAERELADVTSVYRTSFAVLPSRATFADFERAAQHAAIVHIAGHTERQRGSDDAALVFAGGEMASWQTVAATRMREDAIVVLSACETLRRPPSRQRRALSIGAGFIGAGAAEVVGTLAPISDREARSLFHEIHRQLAAGSDAPTAVRQAQLSSAARHDASNAGWRAVDVLTTRIH